jgi:type IV pilus assembly protein PilX
MMNTHISLPSRQSGAVLFVALIFLIILTLLGISNMQSGLMEEKMAGAFRDRNALALESAELALREGEKYLNSVAVGPFNDTVAGLHDNFENGGDPNFWRSTTASATTCPASGTVTAFNWSATAGRCSSVLVTRQLTGTAAAPRYVIEELADVPKPGSSQKAGVAKDSTKVYRITARGVGAQTTTVVILQSTFKR